MIRRLKNEFIWLGTFVLLCLISLTLFRPWATVPPLAHGRVIFDEEGKEFVIPEPFPGVITESTHAGSLPEFIRSTHTPGAVRKIAGRRPSGGSFSFAGISSLENMPYRIYPQLAGNDALWNFPKDMESVLANDEGGVYLIGGAYFKEFGLTTLAGYSHGNELNRIFHATRMYNNLLGQKEYGETLMAKYRRELADIAAELGLDTLSEDVHPRVMQMVDAGWDRVYIMGPLSAPGVEFELRFVDPTVGWQALGREGDAERILATTPDVIFLNVGSAEEVLRDPRWRGMEAVRNGRVYSNPAFDRSLYDIDYRPLGVRWEAEVVYHDRLRPAMRDLMRNHYLESYGYRLRDDDIDDLLYMDANRDSLRYERFASHAVPVTPEM